jgi:hypothetical protein
MNKNSGNIKILYLQLNPDSSPIVRHETWTTLGSSSQELGLAGPLQVDPKRISTSVRLRRPYTPFLKRDPNSLD